LIQVFDKILVAKSADKMAGIPTKEMCEREHARVQQQLMAGFTHNLMSHHERGRKFLYQGSTNEVAKVLILDRGLINYLVLGNNPATEEWGHLKEKFDIEPIKYILRREVVKIVRETLEGYGAKVYFSSPKRDSNFLMKVDFYPYTKKDETKETETATAGAGEEGFKTVRRTFQKKPYQGKPSSDKPEGRKTYAKAAKVPAINKSKATQSETTESE
jgi:hypothetical protein